MKAVNDIVSNEDPDMIVFDCSGRAAEYRHAANAGARVVFISQHKRKRRRGFNLRRLPYIDQHWIVQLPFVDGDLSFLERLKQDMFGKSAPLFTGPIYDDSRISMGPELGFPDEYILYSSGGGGYVIQGEKAPDVFSMAAADVYTVTGIPGIVILGANYTAEPLFYEGVKYIRQMDNATLMNVMKHADVAVLSGGDLLSQAMTMSKAVVAVPVAKDQAVRIRSFAKRGLVVTAGATQAEISAKTAQLIQDGEGLAVLRKRVEAAGIRNGLHLAVDAIEQLLGS